MAKSIKAEITVVDKATPKFEEIVHHLRSIKVNDIIMAETANYMGIGLLLLRDLLINFRLVCIHCDAVNIDPQASKGCCVACGAPLGKATLEVTRD